MHIIGNVLKHLDIIAGRFSFDLVEHRGVYSVYHQFDGSYGQKNFGSDRNQAEQHLNTQEETKPIYIQLVGKKDTITRRVTPLSHKLGLLTAQINAGILRG